MKKIIYLLIALCCANFLYAQEGSEQTQQNEFKRLLQEQNPNAQKGPAANEQPIAKLLETARAEGVQSNVVRFEAFIVQVVMNMGFSYHIADYLDGTRVITCLDGYYKGLQGIAYRGVLQSENRNVEWKRSHFVHFYPYGKISSYPNRQIVELY